MDFIKGLMVEIGVDLKEFRAGLASAKKDLQGFGEQAKSIGGEFSKVSAVFAAAGGWAVKLAGDLEATSLSFRVLTKDAAAAAVIQKQLNDYADKSPFEGDDITLGGKRLIAYKFALRDVIPYLKDAGDLAATFADQGVKVADVASVFGRLKSGNFGEAFERLRDFGIDRSQLEGQGLKFDKSGSYQGSVESALNAVRKIIQTNYGGMADALGTTLPGMIATAWDGIKRFAQDIGATLVESFDIKGLLGEFSGFLTSIKEGFNSLSPTVQKLILGFGALVVVLPPLLAIVGSIITAMPILSAGFAALTGPIGLTVAAVAAAAALIIYHWDSIKKALQDTGAWAFLKNIVKSSLGVVMSVFGVFANAFQGDWANMWEHAKNIVKYAWNGIISIIQGALGFVTKAFTGLLDLIGAPSNAAKLQGFFDKNISAFDGIKASVPPLTNALATLKSGYDKLTGGATEFGDKAKDATDAVKESTDRLKASLDAIKYRDMGGHSVASGVGMAAPNRDFKTGTVPSSFVAPDFTKNIDTKALAKVLKEMMEQAKEQLKQSNISSDFEKTREDIKGSVEGMFSGWNVSGMKENVKDLMTAIDGISGEMLEKLGNLAKLLPSISNSLAAGFEAFGAALAQGKNPFAAFGKSILASFGDMLIMVGKEMLKQATALIAVSLLTGGAVAPVAFRTGAAGAALVVAGGAIKNVPKFADGWGGATGATMAWFGDNSDARTNQEFILRKDQVKSILNRAADSAGMGKGAVLIHEIEGSKLKLILSRAEDQLSLG